MTIPPNLFVVGAMKSGTTSLCSYVAQHPDIYMSPEKEPFYFVEGEDFVSAEKLFRRPDNKLMRANIGSGEFATREAYLRLFVKGSRHVYRAEGSPLYLADPHAAQRIKAMSPDAKIIAVLRNPTARAYSAYTFQRSYDREPAPTFNEALSEELNGSREDWWYGWRYVYTGRYCAQIKRYVETFGQNNVLVLRYEELRDQPECSLARVFRFLKIDPNTKVDFGRSANETRMRPALIRAGFQMLYSESPVRSAVRKIVPLFIRKSGNRNVRRVFERFGQKPPPMCDEDRRLLARIYQPEIDALEHFLEWDLSEWR